MATAKNVDTPEATEAEWEEVATGAGEKFDFTDEGQSFTGTYRGQSELIDSETGEKAPCLMFRIDDEDRFVWRTYWLGVAFDTIEPGTTVKVTYKGKRQMPNGLPIARYEVLKRRQPAA